MKQCKVFLLTILTVFLMAGSALALSFNTDRTGDVIPAGDSLQSIFDSNGIDLDAITDQTIVANWVDTDGDAHAKAVHVEGGNLSGDLYVYDPNGTSVGLLFDDAWLSLFPSFDLTTTFDIQGGQMIIQRPGELPIALDWTGDSFGFAYAKNTNIDVNGIPTELYYTEDDKNPGNNPLALTYNLNNGDELTLANGSSFTATDDDWIIAFEANSEYKDFDEGVFLIEDISPVPEPTTLALFGVGLLGIAGISRRKNSIN